MKYAEGFERAIKTPKSSIVPKAGEIVTWAELVPFTKRSCRQCYGRGYITKLIGKERVEAPQTCNCALKRFTERWGEQIDVTMQGVCWKKEKDDQKATVAAGSDDI